MSGGNGSGDASAVETVAQAERVVGSWQDGQGSLIGLLQAIQSACNYVPPESLGIVARRLDLPLSRVHSVATFYSSFSLEPRGKHIVTCCLGTACHVRGAERVIAEVSKALGIGPGETTEDGLFTLETVRCLGACALAPVVMIDGRYCPRMTAKKVRSTLESVTGTEEPS